MSWWSASPGFAGFCGDTGAWWIPFSNAVAVRCCHPCAGSLYVAGSVLVEHSRLAHERRVRVRVQALVESHTAGIEARAKPKDGAPAFMVAMEEQRAFEQRMLAHNGIAGPELTAGEFDINIRMSGEVLSFRERRRQWALILSALVGVVLLAINAASADAG